MERSGMTVFFLAFVVLSQAEARSIRGHEPHAAIDAKTMPSKNTKVESAPVKAKVSATASTKAKAAVPAKPVKATVATQPAPVKAAPIKAKAPSKADATKGKVAALISPPIHTGSDKKFFGPPFPANYPDDKRPVPDKSILDKLKGPDQPYPALQSKADYDRDYVKDENSDHGDWKAQFEYDTLRRKLQKEANDARGAGNRAGKEGQDVDDAQRNADAAGRDVDDARRGVDEARAAEGEEGKKHDPDDWAGPPSHDKLDKLKAAVADAEKNYEKEKKEFEECKRQLEESKKILDDLKAREAEMTKELAAQTKLWMDTKTVRLNLKKEKESAAHAKVIAAQERLKAAQAAKTEVDSILTDKKANHERALKNLAKEKADVAQAKAELDKATLTLRKIRGYTPPSPKPARSSASMAPALLSLALLATQLL